MRHQFMIRHLLLRIQILGFLVFLGVVDSVAQDSLTVKRKIRDYGIGTPGGFSLIYHFGNTKTQYRISVANIGFSMANQNIFSTSSGDAKVQPIYGTIGLNLAGIKSKRLDDRFELLYGLYAGFLFSSNYQRWTNTDQAFDEWRTNTQLNYQPKLGLIIGGRFWIRPQLALGAEVSPGLFYSMEVDRMRSYDGSTPNASIQTTNSFSNTLGFGGFSTNSAMIYLMYRLYK